MKKSMVCLVMLMASTFAFADGVVMLSGSDIVSYHTYYGSPVATAVHEATAIYKILAADSGIGGGGNVLVVALYGADAGTPLGGFGPATYVTDLTGVTMSGYSGIFFASPGRCCSDPAYFGTLTGYEAALAAYVAGGGNIYVEDYESYPFWDAVLGFDGSGHLIDVGCVDPGTPTALGASAGFAGGSVGCYNHQNFDPTWFSSLGFASLVDGPEGAVILLTSGTPGTIVPEPASLVLVGSGLLAIGRRLRKRA